jgi:hypothetical protein
MLPRPMLCLSSVGASIIGSILMPRCIAGSKTICMRPSKKESLYMIEVPSIEAPRIRGDSEGER